MLNFFRRGGTGQILIGAVVFAIIIVFVLEFRPGREGVARLAMQCAIEVHDECVDRKDYYAAYGLIVPRGITNKRVKDMNLRRHIQEGLVERELLVREAKRLGVSIGEQELDDELAEGRAHVSLPVANSGFLEYSLQLGDDWVRYLPVKDQSDKFDYKLYERMVRNTTNRSPKEFKEMQRRELIAARMRDLVRSRVRVSEAEAWLQYERLRSTAVARVAYVPRGWFAKWAVDLSDAAADAWAKDNASQVDDAWKTVKASFSPGCPLVSEIFVPFGADASDEVKVDKRREIESGLERIRGGASFEEAARLASAAPTANLGGALGCLSEAYGPGSKELLDAVKDMKPGQVSPILETARGFHLLKLHGKLAEADLEKVGRRHVARKLMAGLRADELAKAFADKLVARAKGGAKLDEDLVKELAAETLKGGPKPAKKPAKDAEPLALQDDGRPKVEITAPFPITGSPVPNALPTERPAAALFQLDKPDSVLDKPVATQQGLAVVQLKEKTVAKREDFEKNKADTLRSLRSAKAKDALARYLAALRNQSKDKIKLDPQLVEDQAGADDS